MKPCIQRLSSVSLALAITPSGPTDEPSLAAVEQQFREWPMEAKRLTGSNTIRMEPFSPNSARLVAH